MNEWCGKECVRESKNAGGIKGSIANKRWTSIRRWVGPVPAWGRPT